MPGTAPSAPRSRLVAVLRPLAIGVALAATAIFLVRWGRSHAELLRGVGDSVDWSIVAAASVVWFVTFGMLVVAWGRSMRWWGATLADRDALRMFFLANVARYVPGAVWQFAGIEAMAAAHRVPPLAATSGLLIQQVVLLATGLLWSVILLPGALASAVPVSTAVLLAAGLVAAIALATLLAPRFVPVVGRLAERRLGRTVTLPTPPPGQMAAFVAVHALGWIGYGAAFWLFARGLLGAAAPSPVLAVGAYVASYVAGIVAVFAPGGLVVRETALVAALGPALGVDRALLLAVASRLWLVALELLGAVALLRSGRARG